jgi:hypothetical protein
MQLTALAPAAAKLRDRPMRRTSRGPEPPGAKRCPRRGNVISQNQSSLNTAIDSRVARRQEEAVDLSRLVARLHPRGPRAPCQMLQEAGAERMIRTYLEQLARRYAGLNHEALAAVGANQLPPLRLWLLISGGSDE